MIQCSKIKSPGDRLAQSSDPPSVTRRQGTEGQRDMRQGLVYSAQWRNPYNLGTNLGYQSAVHIVL